MGFGAECRSDELFRAERVSKSYGYISILHDVSLVVPPRSIVGLVGENGAGKTTLFNILTGLTRPDSGAMYYRGERYSPRAYDEAFALGISRVFQEQALILNVPVFENLVLSQEHRFTKFGQLIESTTPVSTSMCAAMPAHMISRSAKPSRSPAPAWPRVI
jgi:ribose transport system ATP-binding protein